MMHVSMVMHERKNLLINYTYINIVLCFIIMLTYYKHVSLIGE